MRSLRWLFGRLLAFGALLFACAVLFPNKAYAQWVTVGTSTGAYFVNSTTPPNNFGPLLAPATGRGKYSYGTYLVGSAWTTDSTYNTGKVWSSVPSNNSTIVRCVKGGTAYAEGNRLSITDSQTLTFWVSSESNPSSSSVYTQKTCSATNYHYFMAKANVASPTEVFPNEFGVIVVPFDAEYVIVTCQVTNLTNAVSSGNLWYLGVGTITVQTELPEDQNEVAAINNQTDTMMSTDGSDGIADSTTVGNQVQQIQGLDIFQLIGNVSEQVGSAITTQEVDTGVTFPGMSLAGFSIPSATIDPMSMVDANTQGVIKLMVTFVFCAAFISHIISLVQAIFGIYEYGVGVEDFGNGSMSFGPPVRAWKGDYSIDEDLGF